MEAPKELEGHRYVGDKRIQKVHDLQSCAHEEAVKALCDAKAYATFGPTNCVKHEIAVINQRPAVRKSDFTLVGHDH